MDRVRVMTKQPVAPSGLWIPTVGPQTTELGKYLLDSAELDTQQSFARVRDEAVRILGQCLPPQVPDQTRTGLVIGYVQSGKTMSMTAVAALARDNGFRIIIAISGTTENLYNQSRLRFERDLRGGRAGPARWVMIGNPSIQEHGTEFQRLVNDWRDKRLGEDDQQPLFITVMKQHVRLQTLADLLASQTLTGINALIIDDEADQAGLNTRPQAPVASTTYQRIRAIRSRLPKHTYIQYTATAQAIILISLLDMLSPDFADVLETGDEYAGGRAFFVDRADLIHMIPNSELPAQTPGAAQPPASLLQAMRLFFLGAAAASIAGKDRHRSMLVHPDRRTGIQRSYCLWVEAIKTRWGDVLRRPEADDERQELAKEFEEPYAELAASTGGHLPPLVTLLRRLAVEIPRTLVTEVNSATGSEVLWDNAFAHILVGGQKLDRGYTVKGLTVTYMPRGPGTWTADTIQQRARFFGYKRRYLGFCRVFLEGNLQDLYRVYVEHEESLRSQVIAHRGHSTRALRRAFILDPRYRPTRQNVLTDPFFRAQTGDAWFKQSSPHVAARLDINNAKVQELLQSCHLTIHETFAQHHVARGIDLQDILRLLGEYAFAQSELLEAYVHLTHLKEYADANPGATATVLVMGPDPRKRTTRDKDSDLIEIHQGRSSKGADSYPGDAALREDNMITLQVHWIRVFEDDGTGGERMLAERVPALALYLPQSIGVQDWLVQPTT